MVKAFSLTHMKKMASLSMMDSGKMTRDTVKAHTRSPMVANMKAISRTTCLMDRENSPGLKEDLTMATGRMACSLAMECSRSQMEASMTECGETTRGQVRAK